MNPSRSEVQVCWSSGAVENVGCGRLVLVDRALFKGDIVVNASERRRRVAASPGRQSESGPSPGAAAAAVSLGVTDVSQLPPPHTPPSAPVPTLADAASVFQHPFQHMLKGIVLSVRQVASVRLLNPVDENSPLVGPPIAQPTPGRETPVPADVPRLDRSLEAIHIRGVPHYPGLASTTTPSEDTASIIRPMIPVSEGDTVFGFGWIGVAERVKVRNFIRLAGGVYFSIVNFLGSSDRGTVVLPDPSQSLVPNDVFPLFPLQRVKVESRCIDSFRCQLLNLPTVKPIADDTKRKSATEAWLNDVASTTNLARGEVVSLDVLEVHVRWLIPVCAVSRRIPNSAVRARDLVSIQRAPVQLGQPVQLSRDLEVRLPSGTPTETCTLGHLLEKAGPPEQPARNFPPIGVVDDVRTTCTVLWDSGEVETNVPGRLLEALDWTTHAGTEALPAALARLERLAVPEVSREAFLDYALHESIFHPFSVVRRAMPVPVPGREPPLPKAPVPFDDFSEEMFAAAVGPRLSQAHLSMAPSELSALEFSTSVSSTNAHIEILSESASSVSECGVPTLSLAPDLQPVPQDARMWPPVPQPSSDSGIVLQVDQQAGEAVVAWIVDTEGLDTLLEGIRMSRKSQAEICRSIPSSDQFPLLAEIGLCVCELGTAPDCPAFIANRSRVAQDAEWQKEIYKGALNGIKGSPYVMTVETLKLCDIIVDPQMSVDPGLVGIPAGEWLAELEQWMCYDSRRKKKSQLPPPWDAVPKYTRFLCLEILASTGLAVWARTGDGQTLLLTRGEIDKVHAERAVMKLDVVGEWCETEKETETESETESEHELGPEAIIEFVQPAPPPPGGGSGAERRPPAQGEQGSEAEGEWQAADISDLSISSEESTDDGF